MKKEFVINIFVLLMVNIIIKPLYIFGIETKIQNLIGPQEYGLYFSLYGLVFLLIFIIDPGIQNFNSLFIAKNRNQVNYYLPRLVGLKLVLLLIFAIVAIIVGYLIGHRSISLFYILGMVLIIFLSTSFVLLRTILSGLGKYRLDSWLSGLDRLILIFILGFIIFSFNSISIAQFITVQILSYILCNGILVLLIASLQVDIKPKFDLTYSQSIIKRSIPYATLILLTAIIMRLDGVLLERMLPNGSYHSGLYSAGYRFLDAANMLGFLFGGLLLPMFANNIQNKEVTHNLLDLSMRMIVFVAFGFGLCFVFYHDDIFNLFFDVKFSEGKSTMQLLMFAFIPITITHVFGAFLLANDFIKKYNWVYFIAVIFSLIGNLILIPTLQSRGAAIIAIATYSLILMGLIILVYKYKLLPLWTNTLWQILWFVVGSIALFYFTKELDLQWIVKIFISSLGITIWSLVIKLFPVQQLQKLIKLNKSTS